MKKGVSYAHEHGKRAYLAMNIIAHNDSIGQAASFLEEAVETGIDGSSYPIRNIPDHREIRPDIPIHISTQASTANYRTVEFWHRLGAKRIIMARELSLEEIREIRKRCPAPSWRSCPRRHVYIIFGRCSIITWPAVMPTRGLCPSLQVEILPDGGETPGQYYPIEEDASEPLFSIQRPLSAAAPA